MNTKEQAVQEAMDSICKDIAECEKSVKEFYSKIEENEKSGYYKGLEASLRAAGFASRLGPEAIQETLSNLLVQVYATEMSIQPSYDRIMKADLHENPDSVIQDRSKDELQAMKSLEHKAVALAGEFAVNVQIATHKLFQEQLERHDSFLNLLIAAASGPEEVKTILDCFAATRLQKKIAEECTKVYLKTEGLRNAGLQKLARMRDFQNAAKGRNN